ncbi:hypothetical protein LHFGNBLO_000064 [Mesorhizobium sp. AR10]|uniref:alcohol dehydrogenase catalytic domain-containing protein n=1 Tax=Mesorhizobium sp. AR10 TaxID=2865839 RepID=UPI00215EFBE5|nr:alcohol dehydrogenase catalytic domain-containing protein [Mesorhizobium sp. AR10]UVK38779.1 hypothetical protein LHFGNBLO_000064 [Mesorhizobium sp. AR10]
MHAIRFQAFGDPSVLDLAEMAEPDIDESTALVRILAASINPNDVKNVAGAMKQTTLPRIPGRDFAGVVERGPVEWIGAKVWGAGGDVGFYARWDARGDDCGAGGELAPNARRAQL